MRKNVFYIDKITNSVEDIITRKSYDTDILRVVPVDLKKVNKKYGWRFDWRIELDQPGRQVFKLLVRGDPMVQGLISLQPLENFIEMHLIEAAPHNYGRFKKFAGVAGNLVAFACKTSFEVGFEGFIAFRVKTRLIQHYIDTLGAELIFRDRMCLSGDSAKKLVNSYFKNYLSER